MSGLSPRPTGRGRTTLVWAVTTAVLVLALSTTHLGGLLQLARPDIGHRSQTFHGAGSYRFMRLQTGSTTKPVTYDSCSVVHVVLNPEGGPRIAPALVSAAVREVSNASGLRIVYDGTTARPVARAEAHGRGRTPPAVLVAFATGREVPRLRGKVAGVGGSTSEPVAGSALRHYVTGHVTLDKETFGRLSQRTDGIQLEQAIVMHELGHVLGLAHVDDPAELMNGHNLGLTSYGPGDREGLRILGHGRCF